MTKLDQMIRELCPDGVEYVELGKLFDLRNGYTPSKSNSEYWENGTIPWFRMEDIREHGRVLSDAIQHVTASALKGKGTFPANSIIVATSATIGEHALILCEALTNQRFVSLYPKSKYENKVNIRFMFYYFDIVDEWCKSNLNEGNFASVDMNKFAKFKIPLPPLAVQSEIVDILDNLTELSAKHSSELSAELSARKKQYEYYRNELLTFGNDVPMVLIGEIGQISAGGDVPKERFSKQRTTQYNIPIWSNGIGDNALYGYTDIPKIRDRCITIAARGTIGYCELRTEPFYPIIRLICVIPNKKVISAEYLKYAVQMLNFAVPTSGIPQLTVPMVSKYKIPLPSLEEQARIVEILDKFNILTTGISEALSSEIEARRKQYEYYRDNLLAFKELEV